MTNIRDIYNLIVKKNFREIFLLQLLLIISSILEVVGLFSIVPFFYLILNSDKILQIELLNLIYNYFKFTKLQHLLILISFLMLIFYTIANLISLFSNYKLIRFSNEFQIKLSNQVYKKYIFKDWNYFSHSKTSEGTRNLLGEIGRVVQGIIQPFININNRLFIVLILVISLLIYNPFITILIFCIYLIIYLFIFSILKKRIISYGNKISHLSSNRYQIIFETFGSMKEILISGVQNFFSKKFEKLGKSFGNLLSQREIISIMPKYIIEITSFAIVLSIVLVLYIFSNNDINSIILNLSIFSVASYKIIPNFQSIYSSVVQINSNIPAFLNIKKDLELIEDGFHKINIDKKIFNKNNKYILIDEISFSYRGKKNNFKINKLNLRIPLKSLIGFVGKTGSGKSTIADLITNLIKPDLGEIYFKTENSKIKQDLSKSFFSYIPQNPFFLDGTILENIAFGVEYKKVNIEKLIKSAKLACLDDFMSIERKSDFENTFGEGNRRLSGGQKQRIAIARAIYSDKPIMIFDESTSALDSITEQKIMKNLTMLQKQKKNTIIFITHKVYNLKHFKQIYLFDKGKCLSHGNYVSLFKKSKFFKKLAFIENKKNA